MLRDIQCDGSSDAWRSWLQSLAEQPWSCEYRVAAETVAPLVEFPHLIGQDSERPRLSITLPSGPTLNSFFFDDAEIDVDLSPEEFISEAQWNDLLAFIAHLGSTTGGEARLSPEGDHGHPWLIYRPRNNDWMTIGQPEEWLVLG